MPHLLKEATNKSPGIIIFTHKEWPFCHQFFYVCRKFYKTISANYKLGIHWGHVQDNIKDMAFVDFHLAASGTLKFDESNQVPLLPFSSRNFLPNCFQPKNIEKEWDFINVSRPFEIKRLKHFITAVRHLFNKNKSAKVLLISNASKTFKKNNPDKDIYDYYLKHFSTVERERFQFFLLHQDGFPQQLTPAALAYFYNASKIFSLFSLREGESRVIHEALLCGLPILHHAELKGGATDHLDATNSVAFKSDEDAAEKMQLMIDNYSQFNVDVDYFQSICCEDQTKTTFKQSLQKYYKKQGWPFEGKLFLDNLSFELPAHVIHLPRWMRQSVSNDLNSVFAVYFYLKKIQKT